tara:strand:- start:3142 stop:3897 length:756 start_codon:yes stop_codon:yes gene_type:complete
MDTAGARLKDQIFNHKTDKWDHAQDIAVDGFDPKKFRKTAKLHNTPMVRTITKHDPKGVYASTKGDDNMEPGDSFVCFTLNPNANVLFHSFGFGDEQKIKPMLFEALGAKNANDFAKKLKALNVDAICHKTFDTETIVINFDCINICSIGQHLVKEIPIISRDQQPCAISSELKGFYKSNESVLSPKQLNNGMDKILFEHTGEAIDSSGWGSFLKGNETLKQVLESNTPEITKPTESIQATSPTPSSKLSR